MEVRLEGAHEAPWWLRTDRPVTTAATATELFRMYRQRWSIEDTCKIGQQCLGWEDVPVRKLAESVPWWPAGGGVPGVPRDWPNRRLVRRRTPAQSPTWKLVLTRGCAACGLRGA